MQYPHVYQTDYGIYCIIALLGGHRGGWTTTLLSCFLMLVLEQPAENQETGTEKSTLNLELLKGKTLEELENIECCESIVQTYSAQL